MRYSKQRELVLQKVEQLCDHPTAEEIFDLAARECPGLSLGTVYRNLNSLQILLICIFQKLCDIFRVHDNSHTFL